MGAETGPSKSPPETTYACRDQWDPRPEAQIPAETAYLNLTGKYPGSAGLGGGDHMDRDWMPTTQSIERVSGQSQEREFSMQRQGDKIGQFDAASRVETAQAK